MIQMKKVANLSLCLVGFLLACTGKQAPMSSARTALESVSLILYYSDGDFDLKTTGEMVLLNTGELLTIQRNVIRPDAALMTSDWNNKFLDAIGAPPTEGSLSLKLDRANGILCNREVCAWVYAICPHFVSLKAGAKCQSYSKK